MRKAYKYLSETVQSLDKDGMLADIWESVYNERLEKHNNKQKARISANAIVYSECLKMFLKSYNKE